MTKVAPDHASVSHRGVGNKSPQEARSHDTRIILMNGFPAFKVFAQSDGLIL
jgi:hypothetical protein